MYRAVEALYGEKKSQNHCNNLHSETCRFDMVKINI